VRLTVDHGHGSTTTVTPAVATNSPYDCFYVYPTVSPESGENADLVVQSAETNVAIEQASPFSQVCRIWAPMYRQVTLSGLFKADAGNLDTAYQSLLSGWNDYLQHYNDGRPVIIIGHSQGAAMAIRLIAAQVDPDPAVRSRLVAALVLGGNLTVPTGRTVGAAFQHIPLCGGSTITRCAIAYSTFSSPPPAGTLFGRPGQGVSLLWLQTATAGLQVACVNPAGLGGGPGSLQPELLGAGGWVSYPDEYTATCRSVAGATWLQVDATNPAGRPVVAQTIGPTWGLHIYDVNLATGNLVQDVAAAERAFSAGG
jgi:pimeloyl-ACP methyl ester carboxylesterase